MKRNDRQKLQAALVSDTFESELDAVTPNRPRLLMPLGNTPVIDYILESLVHNGVDELIIFCYHGKDEIDSHLRLSITATGNPWIQSKEIKIKTFQCDRSQLRTMTNVLSDMLKKNVLGSSFLWIPCDAVFNISNLREMWLRHAARPPSEKCILTMVAVRDTESLEEAQHRVTQQLYDSAVQAGISTAAAAGTPAGGSNAGSAQWDLEEFKPHTQFTPRFTVAYTDKNTNIAVAYQRWDDDARTSSLSLDASLMRKKNVFVRSDLINSGIYICNGDVLSLLDNTSTDRTMSDTLRHIVDQVELDGRVFAFDTAPRNSVVCFLHTLPSYIAANIAVSERVLFPMTRESNFAEQNPNYVVARCSPTVYVHERKAMLNTAGDTIAAARTVGPDVIAGHGTTIPSTSSVRKSVLGRNVRIGKNVVISCSVIFEDVHIGDNVEIHNSVVCSNVLLGSCTFIGSGCIIGAGVHISNHQCTQRFAVPQGTRIVYGGQGSKVDPTLVGTTGRGAAFAGKDVKLRPPALDALFQRDVLVDDDDGSDLESLHGNGGGREEACAGDANFMEGVREIVRTFRARSSATGGDAPSAFPLASESGTDTRPSSGAPNAAETSAVVASPTSDSDAFSSALSALKFTMLNYQLTMTHIAGAVLRTAMEIVCGAVPAFDKSSTACKAVNEILSQFRGVFIAEERGDRGDLHEASVLLDAGDAETFLEAFCVGLAAGGSDGVLRKKADLILAHLYYGLDPDHFAANGDQGCVVSARALLAFDDRIRALQAADVKELDAGEPDLIASWDCVAPYVARIREEEERLAAAAAAKKAKKKAKREAEGV